MPTISDVSWRPNAKYGIIRTHERPRAVGSSRGHGQPVKEVIMDSIPLYRCGKCGEEKPLSAFHKGTLIGGRHSWCRACKCTGPRTSWPERGPRSNPIGQRKGTWTIIAWAKRGRWVARCDCGREKEISGSNWYSGRCVKRCACTPREPNYNKLPSGEAAFNELYNSYRNKGLGRKRNFDLSKEQFRLLTSMDCAYCGSSPSQVNKTGSGDTYIYNGIDRIDSSRGYTWTNCNPCCKHCNFAKMNFTLDEWLEHIKRIYCHMRLGGT